MDMPLALPHNLQAQQKMIRHTENDMAQRRKIEVFTAGCPCCTEAVDLVEFLAGTEHDVEIRDMHDPAVVVAAASYGIRRLPAVVVDGRLADWCARVGLDEDTLTREIFGGDSPGSVGAVLAGGSD